MFPLWKAISCNFKLQVLKYIVVFLKGRFPMKKKILSVIMAICLCCMSACGGEDKTTDSAEIYNASDVKYDTYTVDIGTISEAYYSKAEFDYPYSQNIFIQQSGVITKLYKKSEITEGDVICELLVSDLQEQIDEQKIIYDAAKETYEDLKSSGGSKNDTEYAEINYLLEKNKYDDLLKKKDEAVIYAPFSGNIRIDDEACAAGNEVWEGQYLCTITDKSRTYLCAFIYGDKLNNVNFGSSVSIKQGAIVDCKGKVVDIIERDAGQDYSGFTYVIEPEDGAGLKDFGEIDVVFDVYEKDNVVVVPTDAVKSVGGRTYVNLLIDGAKIETDVELGIQNEREVEILSGLEGGEKIIMNR